MAVFVVIEVVIVQLVLVALVVMVVVVVVLLVVVVLTSNDGSCGSCSIGSSVGSGDISRHGSGSSITDVEEAVVVVVMIKL